MFVFDVEDTTVVVTPTGCLDLVNFSSTNVGGHYVISPQQQEGINSKSSIKILELLVSVRSCISNSSEARKGIPKKGGTS